MKRMPSKNDMQSGSFSSSKLRISVPATNSQDPKRLADSLSDFLKNIGISFLPNSGNSVIENNSLDTSNLKVSGVDVVLPEEPEEEEEEDFPWETVSMPNSDQPLDLYTTMQRPGGEASLLRIRHLFGEIAKMLQNERASTRQKLATREMTRTYSAINIDDENIIPEPEDLTVVLAKPPLIQWETDPSLPVEDEGLFDSRSALVVKPVVVGDAVPPPIECPLSALHVRNSIIIIIH